MSPASLKINLITFRITRKIFLLMGLAPYAITSGASPGQLSKSGISFSYSRKGCAYNIALVTLMLIMGIAVAPRVLKFNHPNYGPLVKSIDAILLILGNTIAGITILIFGVCQQKLVNIGNNFVEYHQKFRVKSSQKCESELKNPAYTVIIFFFLLLCIGLLITCVLLYDSLHVLSVLPCTIIPASFIVQYSLIVKFLVGMLKSVNEAISKIDRCLILFPLPENSLLPGNIGNPRLIIWNLTAARQARALICKISRQVSDFQALPSLLIIFYGCCGCVSAVYFLITNFIIQQELFVNLASLNGCMWILLTTYPIVLLTETVKRFNAEMERTAGLIYDFRGTGGLNKDTIYELNDFAVELLHRNVSFHAYGFFPLDCTLLYSIFGMVVTYLIILLQFKLLDVSPQ